jgi:hypothetical protein
VQVGDDLLERHLLVVVGAERRAAHPFQQLAEGRITRQVGAQHQRVDEEADQVLQIDIAPPRCR